MKNSKYICGSCGDHVNKVIFDEDKDVDLCTNCNDILNPNKKQDEKI